MQVINAASGRPVVLLNPRMEQMPMEAIDYETIYLLRQFSVQPVQADPRVRHSAEYRVASDRLWRSRN